ncbi:MAG: MgtC/SapB family protein [Candidatus Eisenbacteria bacterium]
MILDDPILKLLLSTLLGAVIGWERFVDHKPAGLRTHTLVCLGSTVFVVVGERALTGAAGNASDLTRVMQGVITGIGFLGAGSIIQSGGSVRGLTTAATVWLVAAIGLAVGVGDAAVAAAVTGIALVVLRGFRWIEGAWRERHPSRHARAGRERDPS